MLDYAFPWLKNMMVGTWEVNPIVGKMPQKVASAFAAFGDNILGAKYEFIAYLGSQVANGTNHAILAKQTIVAGVDQVNIVVMKFNEKADSCNLYAIETVLQSGAAFGGYSVNVETGDGISETAMETFNEMTKNWVGTSVFPIALVASKVVKGVNFVFLAKVTPVVPNAVSTVKLVCVNSVAQIIDFTDIL